MKMKIGNIDIEGIVSLGPMAGVTDLPFRLICKKMGCGLLYTEMVSAKAMHYNDKKTYKLMEIDEREKPVAVQVFGHEPDILAEAVEKINDLDFAFVDLNVGCPAPKVVKNGDGSALMKTPYLLEEILKAMVKASKKPVTIKIRKGWDNTCLNAVDIAKLAESCGVSAVAVHGRTRAQFYAGEADWNVIRDVKNAVSIPVIGNGDVVDIESAIAIKEHTNCDGIMVARGAQGNPWLIRDINHYFKTGEKLAPPTINEKIDTALEHFDLLVNVKGDHVGVLEMRKHAAWYLKGVKNSAPIRNEINRLTDRKEIEKRLLSLKV